ncbi:MAG: hypothetical protein Q4C58_15525 [Eubacteriales bacterium]|nr:hypothetical protein [Eubacteriales bacterium]
MKRFRAWMQKRKRTERFKMFTLERTAENYGNMAELKVISVAR